jgi:hypothetical protein
VSKRLNACISTRRGSFVPTPPQDPTTPPVTPPATPPPGIYISLAGSDTTGTGTYTAPYRTMEQASVPTSTRHRPTSTQHNKQRPTQLQSRKLRKPLPTSQQQTR